MKKIIKTFASFLGSVVLLSGTFLSCAFFGSGSGTSVNREPVSSGPLTTERVKSSAPERKGTIRITGGGEFNSLKEALAAAASMSTAKGEYITIEIAPGTYEEEPNIEYKGSANIHLKGTGSAEYGADVRIIGSGSDMQNESKRSVLEIYKGDWIIENITIEHKDADTKAQAEALGHQSNGTLAVKNCSFISRQDTIRTQGKAWFYQCYIEGTIDFLWMETPGKVALYEECRLRAVTGHEKEGKPVKAAYFAAPRASSELTEVYKGLVIYNCILEVESGLDAYLARNPWNKEEYFSTFYNQVAVVASQVYGEVNSAVWKYNANGTSNQQFVGFKTDESFHESSSRIGARLTKQQVADEYSGRRGILNRYYDLTNKFFSRDSGSNWDIDKLIQDVGWSVTADNSKEKLENDATYDGANGTYDFKSVSVSDITGDGHEWSSDDTYVSTSGFVQDGKSHGLCGSASSSITVRLAGISRLGLQLCQYSKSLSCTIKNAVTGEILHTIEDIKADSDGETNDFYYTTPEPVTVKIEFAGSGQVYIHGISVTNFDEFVPVTGVNITGSSSVVVAGSVKLTANVLPENATNKTVKWSSSDKNLATVDSKGKVYARGAGTVTITATSAENEALSGTFEIIVTPEVANDGKTGVTWDFSSKGAQNDATFGGIFVDGKFPADIGFYADDSSKKIDLKISGNFKSNGNCAHHGDGTEIKVPVVTEGDSIYVTGFPGNTDFTIGGTTYKDSAEHRYDATAADVAAGYVTITGNNNMYILKIVARYTTLPNKPVVTGPEAEVEYIFNNYTDTDGSYVLPTGYLKGTSVSKSGGNCHGWAVTAESKIEVTIPASSSASTMISVLCCDFGNHGNVTLKAGDTEIGTKTLADDSDSNTPKVNFVYTAAEETVITITFDGGAFIHGVSYKPYDKTAIPTYTVTFDANQEGVTSPDAQIVEEGGKAIKPDAPSKEGMTFDGWYTAATEGTEVTFTETITSNVTYYGHWTAGEATLEEKAAGFSFVHNTTKLSSSYEGSKGIEYGIEFDGTSGKIAANGDNFLFNSGSVINVKVAEGCTVVPVYHNAGNSNSTISERNAETGVVSITSNANNYLMGFMVVPDVDTTKNAVIDLGNHYTMQVQNHYAKGDFITLNMRSGKFRPNGGGNAQINAGSIIEIPVAEGAVVDCTWYSGATSDYADIAYSAEHSTATITIKAGQNPYIKTVTITYSN